MLIRVH